MWCIQCRLFLLNGSLSNLEEVLAEVKCEFNHNRILFIEKQCKVYDNTRLQSKENVFFNKKCMTIFSSVRSTPFPVA